MYLSLICHHTAKSIREARYFGGLKWTVTHWYCTVQQHSCSFGYYESWYFSWYLFFFITLQNDQKWPKSTISRSKHRQKRIILIWNAKIVYKSRADLQIKKRTRSKFFWIHVRHRLNKKIGLYNGTTCAL